MVRWRERKRLNALARVCRQSRSGDSESKTGSLVDLPRRSGPVRVLAAVEAPLRALVNKEPDLELADLCKRIEKETGTKSSVSMMCRELQRLKLR